MQSKATTVADYIAELPAERQQAIKTLRTLFKKHVPKGYQEMISFGHIAWCVPLKLYPDTYNGEPLMYVAITSQKHHMALHLVCAYMDARQHRKLEVGFKAAGKKLDMGKGCIRFRKFEDLALEPIAEVLAAWPMKDYIAMHVAVHAKKSAAKKSAAKQGKQ